jgi:general secretion pathway protein H
LTVTRFLSSQGNIGDAAGFTLLELLVVLVILSMVTAAMAISARTNGGTDMRVTAIHIAAELRTLREEAVRRQTVTTLRPKEIAARSLSGEPARRLRLPGDLAIGFIRGEPMLIGNVPDRLVFFPDGSSSGGTIRLIAGTSIITIRVNWIDGGVTIDG